VSLYLPGLISHRPSEGCGTSLNNNKSFSVFSRDTEFNIKVRAAKKMQRRANGRVTNSGQA